MTPTIRILNGTSLNAGAIQTIVPLVEEVFATSVIIDSLAVDLARAYDPSRGQYNSTALLALLLKHHNPTNEKRIALVDVDLFIPVLTFVFGEAQLNGTAAIVSTFRLANEYYGLPENPELLKARLRKEIIHELSHTFGLIHCRQFECVMRSSTYVEEIDLKQERPCAACQAHLRAMT